jgi:hypothetical protein
MRFTMFNTPKPKRFNFPSRYYDPQRDEWERRKTELGYDSALSREERIRLQMSKRWEKKDQFGKSASSRYISYLVYAVIIGGSIYIILFTNLIDNFLTLFGVGVK